MRFFFSVHSAARHRQKRLSALTARQPHLHSVSVRQTSGVFCSEECQPSFLPQRMGINPQSSFPLAPPVDKNIKEPYLHKKFLKIKNNFSLGGADLPKHNDKIKVILSSFLNSSLYFSFI